MTNEQKQMELLAPNGKPSNLTSEQHKLVRTPEFKAWFGDWENDPQNASKVVDENGEPLVCYHGSNYDFNIFRDDMGSSHDLGYYGKGFYFTFNPDSKWMKHAIGEAGYYGSIIKSFFIQSYTPFDISTLSQYKGVKIGYLGTESLVFLNNVAKNFPHLSDKITVEKKKYNKDTEEYDFTSLPISVLPNLIEGYRKKLKTFITEDNFGDRNKVTGYVESKIVEYDYTSTGGTKGSYEDRKTLGSYSISLSKEEIEILLICDALEKHEGIQALYQPEGYMTRFPEITDAIKENHDCILQTKYGDELVVFKPTQIKLADGSNTTFDSNNPDIRFKEGGEVNKETNDIVNEHYQDLVKRNLPVDLADYKLKKYLKDNNATTNDGLVKSYITSEPEYQKLNSEYKSEFKKMQEANKTASVKFKKLSHVDRQKGIKMYKEHFKKVLAEETNMDKPKNNVALYTRVKGEKQFKASDFKGNQVDRLVNAPLVSPDKFDEFLKAVKSTAEQNREVDFRIKEFGTNKIWYDSQKDGADQLSKGTEVDKKNISSIIESTANLLVKSGYKIDYIRNDYAELVKNVDLDISNIGKYETIKIGERIYLSIDDDGDLIIRKSDYQANGSGLSGQIGRNVFYDNSKAEKIENIEDLIGDVNKPSVGKYDQLSKGTEVELEHKDTIKEIASGNLTTEEAAQKIASDHIEEDKNYYDKLEQVEKTEEKIIFHPRSIQELKRSLELAKEQELPSDKIYDIQKNYFSEFVSENPTKLGEFLLAVQGLSKKDRFDFQLEVTERYGNTEHIDRFVKAVEKGNYNLYDLLPAEFKKETKVKRIDFTPSPDSEGLAKITDLFVGSDDLRPTMSGVYFDKENSLITATDAHKMIVIAQKPDVEKSTICKMGTNLRRETKGQTEDQTAKYTNADGCYEVEGKYPQYLYVIPTTFVEIFDFDANRMMNYAKTVGGHLTNAVTRQMLLGYESGESEKILFGVNAVLFQEVLKGMQMLGHDSLDLCHNREPSKAIVFVPKGQSRKITNVRIETDLCLLMPVMVGAGYENFDILPIYDLTDNTIKTVAQFYGRETKVETPEPAVESVDPIEPVEEVAIPKSQEIMSKDNSAKIPVSKITIYWAEGDNSGYDKFPKDYKSYEAANKAIVPVFNDYAKDGGGGYNKVKFMVTFADGETYEGRLDVSEKEDNPTATNNVIGQHIKEFLDYQLSEKSKTSEDYKKEIIDWLQKYDLGLGEKISKPKESNDEQEIKDTIDGLEILKGLATSKKDKKEIQDTIDGLKILLEMPETFELGGAVNGSKMLNGYSVRIYSDGTVSANNIVSTKEGRIILVTDGTSGDSSTVSSDEPHLKLNTRNIQGKKILSTEPVNFGAELKHKMFGGTFVWSSDSRFRQDVSEQPIQLHDRVEYAEGGVIDSEMTFVDGNTTYKIEKIPNENRYGIYVTSEDFMDSFGGSTALVNAHSKSVEEAQEKIKKMIEKKMYALGGVIDENEIISELPE